MQVLRLRFAPAGGPHIGVHHSCMFFAHEGDGLPRYEGPMPSRLKRTNPTHRDTAAMNGAPKDGLSQPQMLRCARQ